MTFPGGVGLPAANNPYIQGPCCRKGITGLASRGQELSPGPWPCYHLINFIPLLSTGHFQRRLSIRATVYCSAVTPTATGGCQTFGVRSPSSPVQPPPARHPPSHRPGRDEGGTCQLGLVTWAGGLSPRPRLALPSSVDASPPGSSMTCVCGGLFLPLRHPGFSGALEAGDLRLFWGSQPCTLGHMHRPPPLPDGRGPL